MYFFPTFQVGLSLVVEGEIVLGVMGCPNWQDDTEIQGNEDTVLRSGVIMISHIGCGTWRTRLWDPRNSNTKITHNWTRCLVDRFHQVHEARFCISDSQTWDSLPLATQFSATTLATSVGEKQILLLPTCCGRFTFLVTENNFNSLTICINFSICFCKHIFFSPVHVGCIVLWV